MSQTVIDWSQSYATWVAGDGAALSNFTITSATTSPQPWTWANLIASYIAADYDLTHRGTACSFKGRSANSTGVIADISVAEGQFVKRVSNVLTSAALALSDLPNGSARSVVGRSANSSGAHADISGSGTAAAPQVLTDDGTTASFTAFSTVRAAANVLYEVNYSLLANNTLADGAESIDGLAYVAANMGELGTAAVQLGTGVRMIAATSNGGATAFTSASQLAPYIRVPLSQLAGYDPTADYIVEVYMPSLVLETTGENVFISMWGQAASPYASSGSRIRKVQILNNAGTRVLRTTDTADGTADVAIPTHNVLAFRIGPHGLGQSYSGVWSSGWPTTLTPGPSWALVTPTLNTFNTGDVSIVLGIAVANDASPTTAVTFERMRIRRV